MQLILITGLSGSGKSVALNVLEDSGYYYVDNLPLQLLQQTVEVLAASRQERAALSINLRSARELAGLPGQLADFRKRGHDVRVLFLEAKTDTLIKRFSETRRRHPLADDKLTLTECIERSCDSCLGCKIAPHGVQRDAHQVYASLAATLCSPS